MEHAAKVRAILAANRYMTLATVDERGRPWASPVWFAAADPRELLWVSAPDARHSRNLAVHPDVAIVIFDSRVAVGDAEALYIEAVAEQLTSELDRAVEAFSRESLAQGLSEWTRADVRPPARLRLYRAIASGHFLLGERDQRIPVDLA